MKNLVNIDIVALIFSKKNVTELISHRYTSNTLNKHRDAVKFNKEVRIKMRHSSVQK